MAVDFLVLYLGAFYYFSLIDLADSFYLILDDFDLDLDADGLLIISLLFLWDFIGVYDLDPCFGEGEDYYGTSSYYYFSFASSSYAYSSPIYSS